MNDIRTQRDRQADLESRIDRDGQATSDCASAILVVTTTLKTYPTNPASYFACNPVQIDGAETEGGSATYTSDTNTVVYVLNEGSQVPPVGTRMVAHGVGGRFTTRYDG
jgi:hypothetical protein